MNENDRKETGVAIEVGQYGSDSPARPFSCVPATFRIEYDLCFPGKYFFKLLYEMTRFSLPQKAADVVKQIPLVVGHQHKSTQIAAVS